MANVRDYTTTDALFQIFRILMLVGSCRFTCVEGTRYMTEKDGGYPSGVPYWVVILMTLAGVVVYSVFFGIFQLFMSTCFNCELLGAQDFCLTLDEPNTRHMICTMCFIEPFEWLKMRKHFNEKTKKLKNCRS